MTDTVLVTGLSGFIASHVAAGLLAQGYAVRGTVRNKVKGERIVNTLSENGADTTKLELVEADLGEDAGWKDAVKDCRYVQHIASPFPLEAPSNREALVPAARAGAMRVVEQAIGAGAERVVMTSSMVSMMGQPGRGDHMHVKEEDWSDPDWRPLTAYPVSKTRAERAVWDYADAQNVKKRITTICPGLVFGPDTYDNGGASLAIIEGLFSGKFPMMPRIAYPIVDVRDCASLHIKAMTNADAGGRRLMAASNTLWISDISAILLEAYPKAKLPTREMSNWLVKIAGIFDQSVKSIVPDVGTFHEADAAYVSALTSVIPRPAKDAVLAAAASLIENDKIDI
ncbi:MAG: NAD-dependent epimerase/dehydratase family protein [Litorimonas sp.]